MMNLVVCVVCLFVLFKVYKVLEYLVLKWWNKGPSAAQMYILEAERQINDMEMNDDMGAELTDDDYFVDAKAEFKKVKHHGLFRNYLVSCGRAKFGSPSRTNANLLVVRKFLYDCCKEHGVLPRHIQTNLDFAVEMIFMPSREELLARAVRHTKVYQERTRIRDELGGIPTLP